MPIQHRLDSCFAKQIRTADRASVGDYAALIQRRSDYDSTLYAFLDRIGWILNRGAMKQVVAASQDFLRRSADREVQHGKPGGDDERAADGGERGQQASFGHRNLLQNQCDPLGELGLSQEQWSRLQIRLQMAAGDSEQRVDILLAGFGDADDFGVDRLLAAQLDLSEQPPDGGMKPERRANELFQHGDRPIVAADMRQFMTGDRFLRAGRHRQERHRQQDHGLADSEGHGTRHFVRQADRRPDTEAPLQGAEDRRGWDQAFRSTPIAAQARESDPEPAQSYQYS